MKTPQENIEDCIEKMKYFYAKANTKSKKRKII